jgi:hypothetical protein
MGDRELQLSAVMGCHNKIPYMGYPIIASDTVRYIATDTVGSNDAAGQVDWVGFTRWLEQKRFSKKHRKDTLSYAIRFGKYLINGKLSELSGCTAERHVMSALSNLRARKEGKISNGYLRVILSDLRTEGLSIPLMKKGRPQSLKKTGNQPTIFEEVVVNATETCLE